MDAKAVTATSRTDIRNAGVGDPRTEQEPAVTPGCTAPWGMPAPRVGDVVVPRDGLTWCGKPVPATPHVVVEVVDYRDQGVPECVVVVIEQHAHAGHIAAGLPVGNVGPCLGLVDVQLAER